MPTYPACREPAKQLDFRAALFAIAVAPFVLVGKERIPGLPFFGSLLHNYKSSPAR
jgi:hypothetical protein